MTTVTLPVRLDTPAAAPLAEALQKQIDAGQPLDLLGGDVDVVGLACLQVLAGARATALSSNLSFSLAQPSEAMRDGCRLAGLGILLDAHNEGSPA
jgi:chemotaxis protein CheX